MKKTLAILIESIEQEAQSRMLSAKQGKQLCCVWSRDDAIGGLVNIIECLDPFEKKRFNLYGNCIFAQNKQTTTKHAKAIALQTKRG